MLNGARTPVEDEAAWPRPDAVAAAFGLPGAVGGLDPVPGAWSNRVFRLRVGGDSFALKELRNPWQSPTWLEWLTEAFRFEQVAIAARVAAPEPILTPGDGSFLAWVERRDGGEEVAVRLHRWVEGSPCAPGPVDPAVADWAGTTLGSLHGLGIRAEDRSLFPHLNTDTADSWDDLVASAAKASARWAEALAELGPTVRRSEELAREGLARPTENEVMSHGDIDQKNIVLAAGGPVLCDWDVAAPWVPARELVDTAISLGAARDFVISRRVVTAYEQTTGQKVHLDGADLAPLLMNGLDWLAFNVERAIGLRPATAVELDTSTEVCPT